MYFFFPISISYFCLLPLSGISSPFVVPPYHHSLPPLFLRLCVKSAPSPRFVRIIIHLIHSPSSVIYTALWLIDPLLSKDLEAKNEYSFAMQ
jgi:hypothetical protein